mgnify:CR=1 FL=1
MEYNGNYISDSHQGNFSNFDAKKVYNKNLSINRDNTKQNEIKKSHEQNININEKSSNDSSIINNDYNFSFISSLFESKHNDKIHSTNFQQLNNKTIILGLICFLLAFMVTAQMRTINVSATDISRLKKENELRDQINNWKDVYDTATERINELYFKQMLPLFIIMSK